MTEKEKKLISEVVDVLTLLLGDMEMQKVDALHIRMIAMANEKLKEICESCEQKNEA